MNTVWSAVRMLFKRRTTLPLILAVYAALTRPHRTLCSNRRNAHATMQMAARERTIE